MKTYQTSFFTAPSYATAATCVVAGNSSLLSSLPVTGSTTEITPCVWSMPVPPTTIKPLVGTGRSSPGGPPLAAPASPPSFPEVPAVVVELPPVDEPAWPPDPPCPVDPPPVLEPPVSST